MNAPVSLTPSSTDLARLSAEAKELARSIIDASAGDPKRTDEAANAILVWAQRSAALAPAAPAAESAEPVASADEDALWAWMGVGETFSRGCMMTVTSGDGFPYVKIVFEDLHDAQAFHRALIDAHTGAAPPAPRAEPGALLISEAAVEAACLAYYGEDFCRRSLDKFAGAKNCMRAALNAAARESVVTDGMIETAARAIASVNGNDPDDEAPIGEVCGSDNEPQPWWRFYEEDARAALGAVAHCSVISASLAPASRTGGAS